MIYQFEHDEIKRCRECPCHSFVDVPCDDDEGWCDLQDAPISSNSRPQENDCPLAAISKTETTSCEWCDGGIDTASLMDADMMMRFVRPVNYCPNCGRPLPKPPESEVKHDG